jgi:hypothetical protein
MRDSGHRVRVAMNARFGFPHLAGSITSETTYVIWQPLG